MKTTKLILMLGSLALLVAALPRIASANLVLVGPVNLKGTGFGNVNTILTVQALGQGMGGTESGCVGLNSSGNQIDGSAACQGANAGGNEKPPDKFPHNQVFQVSDAATLAIVFNTDQPGGSSIVLNDLVLTLYNAQGAVGFTSGDFASAQDFASTSFETGIGKSGWEFMLDAPQTAQAQAAMNAGFDFLGLSTTISGASGGPETFFLTTGSDSSPTPEPASLALLGIGLLVSGVMMRRKRGVRSSSSTCVKE